MMEKLYGIQYLRALAALGVVAFHAAERTGGAFVIGAAGVDVFFVVSGFIMMVIAERRPVTPARFLRERLERIAPAYWIATAVMIVGGLAGLFPNLTLTVSHVLESVFFVPHRSPNGGEIWPLLVQGWTLNYEMFFYVLFAGVLAFSQRSRLLLLAAIFVPLAAIGLLVDSENPLFLTYTDPRILEFLLGALIGRLWLRGRIPAPATGLGLIVLAIAGFTFVGVTWQGFNAWVIGPLSAALVAGTLALEAVGRIGHWRPLTWLGDGSYSIYLWHTFAISVVAKAAGLLSLPPALAFTLALVLGTAVGLACYELLEKPLVAVFRRRRALDTAPPTSPAIA